MNNHNIKLADIAKAAGVSAGTVSRALSGVDLVNEATKKRIMEIAAKMNYQPNIAARNLRTKKTGAIAVIIPLGHDTDQHISDPFFIVMLGYLADALSEKNYDVLLSRVIPKDENWLQDYIQSGRADGIIIIGQSNQSHIIEKAAQNYKSMVVWGANLNDKKTCIIGSDNRLGGLIASIHLVERGCKNIAFFGDPNAPEIEQRLDGCRAGAKAAGLEGEIQVLPTHLTADAAYRLIAQYLDEGNLPDGIMAASDVIAMSALRALAERGIKVPQQVKITGYDDLELANYTNPPLTTVKQDIELSAKHLVDALLKRMAGEESQSQILPPRLIVRNSTAL